MKTADWARYLALCAIWGSSFVFIRICAPVFGPVLTATGRVAIGGAVLLLWLTWTGFDTQWRQHRWAYAKIGVLNSGIPFLCFGVGALWLPSSLLAIINACTPLFGAIFAAIWLGEGLGIKRVSGVILGLMGVTLANGLGNVALTPATVLAIVITLLAPVFYALSSVYLKLKASHLQPKAIAAWSLLSATPILLLGLPFSPPLAEPVINTWGALFTLGMLCTGMALVIFYRLVADIGPVATTTVTFILPIFGMFWGWLILSEAITLGMVGGSALLIVGTLLVMARPPARTIKR
jgi:drug/metabolite transporter (DMT)-like permease